MTFCDRGCSLSGLDCLMRSCACMCHAGIHTGLIEERKNADAHARVLDIPIVHFDRNRCAIAVRVNAENEAVVFVPRCIVCPSVYRGAHAFVCVHERERVSE